MEFFNLSYTWVTDCAARKLRDPLSAQAGLSCCRGPTPFVDLEQSNRVLEKGTFHLCSLK